MEENNSRRQYETMHRSSSAHPRTGRESTVRTTRSRRQNGGLITPVRIIILAVILIAVVVLVFVLKGCLKNKNTAAGIAEKLVEESVGGNIGKMSACYGVSDEPGAALSSEMEAAVEYYKAHNAKKVSVVKSDILYEDDNMTYVFVRYDLVLEDDEKYPCLRTFMTHKIEDKWYVMETSAITDSMKNMAQDAFDKFTTSDTYKEFNKDYETFLKKNPGYEERIATKLA